MPGLECERLRKMKSLEARQSLVKSKLKALDEIEKLDRHALLSIEISKLTDQLIDEQIAIIKDLIIIKTTNP